MPTEIPLAPHPMRIILTRHGKPKLHPWPWIAPRQMPEWIAAYNGADIHEHEVPAATVDAAAAANLVISSTLPRAVQSAARLNPERPVAADDLFCEAELPHSHWPAPKLPLALWSVIFRLAWFRGFSANAESFAQADERARRAAARLIEQAREHRSVLLVGHGIMNLLIARHLQASGWIGPKRPASGYWKFSVYQAA